MGNSSKEAIQFKDIPLDPKVREGVNYITELVMSSIRSVYPTVRLENINGQVTESLMIRTVEQVHAVTPDELHRIEQAEKRADDIFLYTLLKDSGIPEDQLLPLIHRTIAGEQLYYNLYGSSSSKPQIYFHQGYFDDFLSEDKADKLSAAFNLGVALIGTNLDLAPTPREIPAELRGRFKSYIIDQKEGLISSLESQHQQDVDSQTTEVAGTSVRNIDITRNFMEELINREAEGYNPRFVTYGGKVLFIMPHQSLTTAELIIGSILHRGICQHLAKPILDLVFDVLTEEYGAKGMDRKPIYASFLPPDFMKANQRIGPFLDSFSIRRRLIDVYRNSEIPLIYDQKVDNKKGKFDPNKYPD